MALRCANCHSHQLEITAQSYSEDSAFEAFECQICGATGSLHHTEYPSETRLFGEIESVETPTGF